MKKAEAYIAEGNPSYALDAAQDKLGHVAMWRKKAARLKKLAAIAKKAGFPLAAGRCLKDAEHYAGLIAKDMETVRAYLYDAQWAIEVATGKAKPPE